MTSFIATLKPKEYRKSYGSSTNGKSVQELVSLMKNPSKVRTEKEREMMFDREEIRRKVMKAQWKGSIFCS